MDVGSDNDRVVVIGDIHGDLDALLRALLGMRILGLDGRWTGGSSQVVLIGDLNDRGADSVAVMDLIMDLEEAARVSGGRVHALLGNHELLAARGDFSYVRSTEVLALEYFRCEDRRGLDAVYRGNSPWARWVRSRPTLLKIGETLFAHAGVDLWALDLDASFINKEVQAWVAHFQGVARQPAESTYWLIAEGGGGPLWNDRFDARHQPMDANDLRTSLPKVLAHWGARRIVVGHVPTKSLGYSIAYPHPLYGDAAALVDTGISKFFGGRLSALEIVRDSLTPCYFDRGDSDLELTERLRVQFEKRRNDRKI